MGGAGYSFISMVKQYRMAETGLVLFADRVHAGVFVVSDIPPYGAPSPSVLRCLQAGGFFLMNSSGHRGLGGIVQGMQACTPLDGESGTGRVAIGPRAAIARTG